MNTVVKEYISRKIFNNIDITPEIENKLEEVVSYFGNNAFNRNSKILSARIINDTIPLMVKHKVSCIKTNIKLLDSVKRNSLEHYKLIYGPDATDMFNVRNSKCLNTLDGFVARHGLDKGTEKYNNKKLKDKTKNTEDHFVKLYGAAGIDKFNTLKENRKNCRTKDWYVEKYGTDIGLQKFLEIKSTYPRLCLEKMIAMYGEAGILKYAEIRQRINNSFKGARASTESLDVFLPIMLYCESIKINNVYVGYKDLKEWFLWNVKDNEFYTYDFYIPDLGLIFEFNGEHVHPNKESLTDTEWNNWRCAWTGVTADIAYAHDLRKLETARNAGIDVISLWRADGITANIEKCKTHINARITNVKN